MMGEATGVAAKFPETTRCVIPSEAVLQAERGISRSTGLGSFVTDKSIALPYKELHGLATLLHLHRDQGPKAAILYVGMTGDIRRRVWQHKNKSVSGFTERYNLTSLVYFECFVYPDAAIRREKEIKGWRRSKKLKLIESMNPRWDDLARDWQDMYEPSCSGSGDPSLRLKSGSVRDDAGPGLPSPRYCRCMANARAITTTPATMR
jgi:putative endonuclease